MLEDDAVADHEELTRPLRCDPYELAKSDAQPGIIERVESVLYPAVGKYSLVAVCE